MSQLTMGLEMRPVYARPHGVGVCGGDEPVIVAVEVRPRRVPEARVTEEGASPEGGEVELRAGGADGVVFGWDD